MCAIAFRGVLGVQWLIAVGFVHWSSMDQQAKNTTTHNFVCNSSIFLFIHSQSSEALVSFANGSNAHRRLYSMFRCP